MTASNVELVLNIEGAELRMLHQQVLLCEAKPEDVEAGGVGGGPGDQGLADLEPPFSPSDPTYPCLGQSQSSSQCS